MQHPIYGTFGKLYRNPFMSYFKQILTTNIKLLYTYPKTVYYSARYNAGERFILDNTQLYPHNYDIKLTKEQENEPLRLSTKLYASVREFQVLEAKEVKDYFSQKSKLYENLIYTFTHLYYINELNDNIDLPVAVYARILYAHVLLEKKGIKLERGVKKAVLDKILNRFLEKVEFADAESISQVAHYLGHCGNKHNVIWDLLINNLRGKLFYPEFTKVSHKNPHVFRYVETSEKDHSAYDKNTQDLYINGYRPVVDLYNALKQLGVSTDTQKDLELRFPMIKNYSFNI
jgi:hypothetical protein